MKEIKNKDNIEINRDKKNKQEKKENQDSSKDINNEKEEEKKEAETSPLIGNKKLIKILIDMNDRLDDEENKNKKLEEIYEKYNKKKINKENIRGGNSNCFNNFMFLFIAGIFVIVNLVGIFTIKSIMDSLFKVLKDSLNFFLLEESDIEEKELTDFKSLYNSPYNFYAQYFKDLSENKIDLDLIMFWDFIGLLFNNYFQFTCTSIFFLLANLIILALIFRFDFLNLDLTTHKYSFFQILYIALLYLFLWISVGSSALLQQKVYIDYFEIYKKQQLKKEKQKNKAKISIDKNEQIQDSLAKFNPNEEISSSNNYSKELNKEKKIQKVKNNNNFDKIEESEIYKLDYYFMIYITIFLAFFINYIINNNILKYRRKYITDILRKKNKKNAFTYIYSFDKKIFLLFVCLFYLGEIVLSIVIYSLFYNIVFISEDKIKKNDKKINGENKEIKENNFSLNIEDASVKRICGYLIFNQILTEEESSKYEKGYCFLKIIGNFCCYFFESFTLILITFRKCIINSFCALCKNNLEWKCCKDTNCCCCDASNFTKRDITFCLCYQEKSKLEWFDGYINSIAQIKIVHLALLMAIFRCFTIGFEVIFKEKNENNNEQENITVHLIMSFLSYIIGSILAGFLLKCLSKNCMTLKFPKLNIYKIFHELFNSTLRGTIYFIVPSSAISSFILSIIYLTNNNSLYDIKYMYYPIFWNKYILFILFYFCLTQDEKNEIISYSSILSVYLFIIEQGISGIKSLLSLKGLIILQIIFSSIIILNSFLILMFFIFYYNSFICSTIVSLPILILCCPCTFFFICYKTKRKVRVGNSIKNQDLNKAFYIDETGKVITN